MDQEGDERRNGTYVMIIFSRAKILFCVGGCYTIVITICVIKNKGYSSKASCKQDNYCVL